MEIQINGHPIDFTMESEKNLDQLVDSISVWARERDLIFTEAWVDDQKHPVASMPGTPLEKVGTVNCVILSRAELVINSINEAMEYCMRLADFMGKASLKGEVARQDIDEMKSGIDWLVEVTIKILTLLSIDITSLRHRDRKAADLFEELKDFRIALARIAPDGAAQLLGSNRGIIAAFHDMLRIVLLGENMRTTILGSIDSPDTVMTILDGIIKDLPGQVGNLEEAAIAYQSGRDGEGSSRIENFIDFIYRYFRMSHQVGPVFNADLSAVKHDGMSLAEKNDSINELLNRMLGSLENNDIISLSDILEYEMKPALEGVEPFCADIFSMIHRGK